MSDASAAAGTPETNGKATLSLVLGILSVTLCGLFAGIAAILLGTTAQKEISASGGLQGGESRAKWGIILGWISVGISILVAIITLITFASG